ncbi:MAG: hypothetical protein WC716_10590 [Chitinophagaceae bacterium]|jgi:hypothetical protein
MQFCSASAVPLFNSEFYIVIFVVLGILLGGLVFVLRSIDQQKSMLPTIMPGKIDSTFKSKVSQPKLVNAIVEWCIHHIGDKQNQPNIEISYYPHRKKYGCYLIDKKLIRIYIKNHKNIETLALTIIHEFVHYIEIKTDKESKNYARLQHDFGYKTNPYERSANLIAAQYYQQCLMDLSAKGYLTCELPLV